MCVSWSVSNWDLRSHLLRNSGLGYLPQDALDKVGIPYWGEWKVWCSYESLHMAKTLEQMVRLPPTHPSRFQQERKLGKVKPISSRICKLSYSVGKQTLKIVTWGRPISLIPSIFSLLPPQSAVLPLLSLQQQSNSPGFKATLTSWETPEQNQRFFGWACNIKLAVVPVK